MSDSDAIEKTRNWLSKHGYPFEMKVALEFIKRKFAVTQSDYYQDDKTGVSREIDVSISRFLGDHKIGFDFEVLVECKNKISTPFLCFLQNNQDTDPHLMLCKHNVELSYSVPRSEQCKNIGFWNGYGPYAYSITTVGKEEKGNGDMAYEATLKILQAAHIRVKEPSFIYDQKLVVPMVVTGSPLLTAKLGKGGQMIIKEAECVTLNWRNIVNGVGYNRIQIATLSGLRKIAKSLKSDLDLLEMVLKEDPEIFKKKH